MKRILSLSLALALFLLLFPACSAADLRTLPDVNSMYRSRMASALGCTLYIDDPEYGTVSFISPEMEKEEPYLADLVRGLSGVVQIVHSENCNFDFEAAFLLRDGTVICTDNCGHFDRLQNVIKLSDDGGYALLKDGSLVDTQTRRKVLDHLIDLSGDCINCFAVTTAGTVAPIETDLPAGELEEIMRWRNVESIEVFMHRYVCAYSSDGRMYMTGETRKFMDGRNINEFFVSMQESFFTVSERAAIKKFYVDLTNDGYDDLLLVIPFDWLYDGRITEYAEYGKLDSKKILVFSNQGNLIYSDVINTTRDTNAEYYCTIQNNAHYILKRYRDRQVPYWWDGMQLFSLTNRGQELHLREFDESIEGKTNDPKSDALHEAFLQRLNAFVSKGFPIAVYDR